MRSAWTSERSLRLTLDTDDGTRALRVARAIESRRIPGIASARSTLGFVCVRIADDALDRAEVIERATLEAAAAFEASPAPAVVAPPREVVVPVCYDVEFAPDLELAARELGICSSAVIDAHAGGGYHASFLGFSPGFAYLTGVDPVLAVPRRASPRPRVEAGSVAIANAYTGVYPRAMPGGWRIIGRTPMRMFDPRRARPCAIEPGDRVRFTPINRPEFDAWREDTHG